MNIRGTRVLVTGASSGLARRITQALRMDHDTIVYPGIYQTGIWFGGLARWVVARGAPTATR